MSGGRKFKVTVSFSSRFGVIALSCLTIWALSRILRNNVQALKYPTTAIVLPSIFQQVQLFLSFAFSSILPCIRYLFQSSDVERVPDCSLDGSQASVLQPGRVMGGAGSGGWHEKNKIPSVIDDNLQSLGEPRESWGSSGPRVRPKNPRPPYAA